MELIIIFVVVAVLAIPAWVFFGLMSATNRDLEQAKARDKAAAEGKTYVAPRPVSIAGNRLWLGEGVQHGTESQNGANQ